MRDWILVMIPRYSHPLVSEVHSDEWTYGAWLRVETAALDAQIRHEVVPRDAKPLLRWLRECHVTDETTGAIRAVERTQTHHDVAAFLQFWRDARGQDDGKWLHFGLTSSDVVDTAMGLRFDRLRSALQDGLVKVMGLLTQSVVNDLPMLGRTHGQPAEPTSMRARSWHWVSWIEMPTMQLTDLTRGMCKCKLSGPVGTFAHNPPEVEVDVARQLGLVPMREGASQIIPRSHLAMWASAAATLLGGFAKIAMDLRLMNLAGEVHWKRSGGHVASSAMAHKNNPIEAEQMSGFYRIAQGYAHMLAPMELWLERDISHSSVERVAVPDLWHILLTATERMAWLLENMSVEPLIIETNLAENSNAAWTHKTTLDAIIDGMGWAEAREYATGFDIESYDIMGDAKWFMNHYPKGKL